LQFYCFCRGAFPPCEGIQRRSLRILLARRYPDPTRDSVQPPSWVFLDPFCGDAFAHDLTSQTFDDRKNVGEIGPDLFANLWIRDKTER
jgi:hypothetical protein